MQWPSCVRRGCSVTDACPHDDIQPIPGDEDWGRCVACGDEGYPMTERAAYGDVTCGTCHDTGMVPVDLTGQTGTRRDGTTVVYDAGHFADARCPDCGGEDDTNEAARANVAAMGDVG